MDTRPRYTERYIGERYTLAGRRGTDVVLHDEAGQRVVVVTAAAFERAYEALDVVAHRVAGGWELRLGDRFLGSLARTGAAFSLLEAGARRPTVCRSLAQVHAALDLDPDAQVLGV